MFCAEPGYILYLLPSEDEIGVLTEEKFPSLQEWITSGKRNSNIEELQNLGVLSTIPEVEVAQRTYLGELVKQAQTCQAPLRSFRGPKLIHFELTSRCPLHCPQCYNYLTPKKDLELETVYAFLQEAAEIGTFHIALSGGEPLLYPYLNEVVKRIKELGMKSTIATSGLGLTAKCLAELAQAGMGWVWVSVNGSTNAVHSLSRDGYQDAILALEQLKHTSMRYGINWVARRDNVNDFPELVALARKYKVKAINILRLKPDEGKHVENYLEGNEFNKLGDYLRGYSDEQLTIGVESCFSPLRTYLYGDSLKGISAGCAAGRSMMAVDVEGKLRPCRHLQYPESYSSIKEYWANSETLNQLRLTEENVAEPCSHCSHVKHCRTCRASCQQLFGSFYAGEERCSLAIGKEITKHV